MWRRRVPPPVTVASAETGAPVVREAMQGDLLSVFRIEQRSFPQPWPFAAFERFVGAPGFLVAEVPGEAGSPGRIVGYVVADTVRDRGQPIGHVKDIAVHPDARGEGTGARLLERALSVLADQGVAWVKLEVREGNDAAISLYHQFGFAVRTTVPSYYGDGEDALVMVRDR
ncbi:MAG: ribosomal protein S18-alanine N-acetyltransferase [Haloarculaceae archaeon]